MNRLGGFRVPTCLRQRIGESASAGSVGLDERDGLLGCFYLAPVAQMIGEANPRTGERLSFESPIPEDMAGLMERLREI